MSSAHNDPAPPTHQPAASAPARWVLGGRVEVRLSGDQTAGWLCVHEHRMPPGAVTPLHVHPDDDESFIVLEGTVRFHLAGREIDAGPDDALHIPRGTAHAHMVISTVPARLLVIGTPAGHERFFIAAGDVPTGEGLPDAAHGAPPDMARMVAAAADAGFQILGPPPFAPPGA